MASVLRRLKQVLSIPTRRASLRKRSQPRGPHQLRLLICSDLRVQSLSGLVEWVAAQPEQPDLILYAGDDCDRFTPDILTNYWHQLAALSRYGLLAVQGNDDDPRSAPTIVGTNVHDLGRGPRQIGDFVFHGVPGAEDRPDDLAIGYLLTKPAAIQRRYAAERKKMRGRTTVLLSHAPPYKVLDSAIRFTPDGTRPIGSTAVRRIVEEDPSVRLVVSGHCHLMGGQSAALGQATVINAASHDRGGSRARLAWATLTHEGVTDPTWHEPSLAVGFEGIPDLGGHRAGQLKRGGIENADELAAAHPEEVGRLFGWRARPCVRYIAAARAVMTGEPVVFAPLVRPVGPRLLLDIETDLAQRRIWIVGILNEADGAFTQLAARRDRDEPTMLLELRRLLDQLDQPVLTWSGTRFDERTLLKRYDEFGIVPPQRLLQAEDLILLAKASTALPVNNWKLDSVCSWVGFRYRHEHLDGMGIGFECERSRRTGKAPTRDVLEYNEDDCRALVAVLRRLEEVVEPVERAGSYFWGEMARQGKRRLAKGLRRVSLPPRSQQGTNWTGVRVAEGASLEN